MWVWFDKDTTVAARMVQHWRTGSNPILCKAPKQENIIAEWDYAIVAPASDRSTQVCGALLKTGKPFACLVPHDLVNYVAIVARNAAAAALLQDPAAADPVALFEIIQARVQQARKLVPRQWLDVVGL
jgi:hypothetical protein